MLMIQTQNNRSPMNIGGGGTNPIRINTISPRPNPDTYTSNRLSTNNMNDSGMATGTGNNLSHAIQSIATSNRKNVAKSLNKSQNQAQGNDQLMIYLTSSNNNGMESNRSHEMGP